MIQSENSQFGRFSDEVDIGPAHENLCVRFKTESSYPASPGSAQRATSGHRLLRGREL
jgi:hypothetical protein